MVKQNSTFKLFSQSAILCLFIYYVQVVLKRLQLDSVSNYKNVQKN